jgi:carboxylate-amine ligase
MSRIEFNSSPRPTLGVEVELALVDAESLALRSACGLLLADLPADVRTCIKPELMQCYVELNTDVCQTVADAEADLRRKLLALEAVADAHGVRLFWSATHPFSRWVDQRVTDSQRYHGLINLLQDTARQLITFGLHVHVGVDSGDKAVMICDRILRYLPIMLAASANSPWWEGRVTGLHSWRSKVMDGLPTAGLPPLMRNWSEYVWLINHLIDTGYIESIREIWWDVRPHHNFGTVEVRICDVPGSLDDVAALTALVQCVVKTLSDEIDEGAYQHDCHPMLIRQNKWRAARYGLDAEVVESTSYELRPVREVIRDLVARLRPASRELDCEPYLQRMLLIADQPTWAQRQIDAFRQSGDRVDVVRQMTEASRLTGKVGAEPA